MGATAKHIRLGFSEPPVASQQDELLKQLSPEQQKRALEHEARKKAQRDVLEAYNNAVADKPARRQAEGTVIDSSDDFEAIVNDQREQEAAKAQLHALKVGLDQAIAAFNAQIGALVKTGGANLNASHELTPRQDIHDVRLQNHLGQVQESDEQKAKYEKAKAIKAILAGDAAAYHEYNQGQQPEKGLLAQRARVQHMLAAADADGYIFLQQNDVDAEMNVLRGTFGKGRKEANKHLEGSWGEIFQNIYQAICNAVEAAKQAIASQLQDEKVGQLRQPVQGRLTDTAEAKQVVQQADAIEQAVSQARRPGCGF